MSTNVIKFRPKVNPPTSVEDALWDLLVRYDGDLCGNYVFVTQDEKGNHFADIDNPKGVYEGNKIVSQFRSPF